MMFLIGLGVMTLFQFEFVRPLNLETWAKGALWWLVVYLCLPAEF